MWRSHTRRASSGEGSTSDPASAARDALRERAQSVMSHPSWLLTALDRLPLLDIRPPGSAIS